MIAGINESKTLTKHISCKCKCKTDGRNQKWNNNKCSCKHKNERNIARAKNIYIWNPATCSCKSDKSLASIIDDSVITCD